MLFRFVLLFVFVGACLYVQFYLAHRQLKRLKGMASTEIDPGYIRAEDYFGRSFRSKLREWIKVLPGPREREHLIAKGRENIQVVPKAVHLGGGCRTEDIIATKGEFSCGPDSRLTRELYVDGPAVIGHRSILQAAAVDGDLRLEEDVRVLRWIDAKGDIALDAGCRVGSRVTSASRITLGPGCAIKSAFAQAIMTPGCDQSKPACGDAPADGVALINTPQHGLPPEKILEHLKLRRDKWHQLSPDCWLYEGDFQPAETVWLATKLVIRGNCRLTANSVVKEDLKAGRHLILGNHCQSYGNLIAAGDIEIGEGAIFSGVVSGGGQIRLRTGVRGRASSRPVVVYAGEDLTVASNVMIEGKLSAGGWVLVEPRKEIA